MADAAYLFVTCQRGAEKALKAELSVSQPEFRASFSRPGFVTFKVPAEFAHTPEWSLESRFARQWCWSLGKATDENESAAALTKSLVQQLQQSAPSPFHQLHVWPRDAAPVGHRGFEPGETDESRAAREALLAELPSELLLRDAAGKTASLRAGQRVLDVVLVEPGEWWFGWHTIRRGEPWSRWPGGIFVTEMGEEIVSRAYLKMREGITTFRWPVKFGDTVIEIGSSPGGASQALLGLGLKVIGVDPAEMHETLLAEKKFTHWRMRGSEVKKTSLRGVKWLTADLNVAPDYTLDTVEDIVTNQHVRIAGLLLTIKLPEWDLAAKLPKHLARVKSWGYKSIRARQLSHNRQEYCLCALREAPKE
jgi:23S rRNA (cytidine2498-2'-O)-methyltransferase